jgi:hypothetical protein
MFLFQYEIDGLIVYLTASTNCPYVLLQIFRVKTVSTKEYKIFIQWIAPSKLVRVQLVYCIEGHIAFVALYVDVHLTKGLFTILI